MARLGDSLSPIDLEIPSCLPQLGSISSNLPSLNFEISSALAVQFSIGR